MTQKAKVKTLFQRTEKEIEGDFKKSIQSGRE